MKNFNIRIQLTLFISNQNELIEKIRAEFNPVQFKLIPAHVTLCRENEIEHIEKVIENIISLAPGNPLRIEFDKVERFDNGKGLLIPAKSENTDFNELRKSILKGLIEFPVDHHPHLTLMHPRNSTCTDEIFNQILNYNLPTELNFDTISLIEQSSGGPWKIKNQFPITKSSKL